MWFLLMAEYEKVVRAELRKHGCYKIRQGKGDHEVWHSPINHRNFTVDGKIKSRYTANAVMIQAGIKKHF